MVMPLTYSIAYGLIAGIMMYVIMQGTTIVLDKIGLIKQPVFDAPDDNTDDSTFDQDHDEQNVNGPQEDNEKNAETEGKEQSRVAVAQTEKGAENNSSV